MSRRRFTRFFRLPLIAQAVFWGLMLNACTLQNPASPIGPDAYNTQVAQTAFPPAVTAPPSAVPSPTSTPDATRILISASVSLPRHTALDLETMAVSAPLVDTNLINQNLPDLSGYYKKAPAGSDFVFWAENPTVPDWQFLYPVNGLRFAVPLPKPLTAPSYDGCIKAFSVGLLIPGDNDAFALDYSVFVTYPGGYDCFVTGNGNLGTFKLTPPGNYVGMATVTIEYIVWDAKLP